MWFPANSHRIWGPGGRWPQAVLEQKPEALGPGKWDGCGGGCCCSGFICRGVAGRSEWGWAMIPLLRPHTLQLRFLEVRVQPAPPIPQFQLPERFSHAIRYSTSISGGMEQPRDSFRHPGSRDPEHQMCCPLVTAARSCGNYLVFQVERPLQGKVGGSSWKTPQPREKSGTLHTADYCGLVSEGCASRWGERAL